MNTITAHVLVKNESRFVWYAVMSVIDHVDKVLLWDTGSSDGTVQILKEIKKQRNKKVDLRLLGEVTPDEFTKVRSDMLQATDTDWFLVVDADEIWWEDSISEVTDFIRRYGSKYESVVVPTINPVGDIYHFQEEAAGRYRLAGRVGHLGIRGVSTKIPGLSSDKPHGTWGWTDGRSRMIQDRNPAKIKFIDSPYIHTTFLRRSESREEDLKVPKRARKLKHEIGISFPNNYFYPEVFFRPRPSIVQSPWEVMSLPFRLRSYLETPLRKIKRRALPKKVGY